MDRQFHCQWPERHWASQRAEKEKCHRTSETALLEVPSPLNFTSFLPPSPSRNSFLETTSFLTSEASRQRRLQMVKDNELERDERSRQTHSIIPQLFHGTSRNVNVASPACPQICPKVIVII